MASPSLLGEGFCSSLWVVKTHLEEHLCQKHLADKKLDALGYEVDADLAAPFIGEDHSIFSHPQFEKKRG